MSEKNDFIARYGSLNMVKDSDPTTVVNSPYHDTKTIDSVKHKYDSPTEFDKDVANVSANKEHHDRYVNHKNAKVREALVFNRHIGKEHIERLANDTHESVRAALAASPLLHNHPDISRKLMNDDSHAVVKSAVMYRGEQHKDLLHHIAKHHTDPHVAATALDSMRPYDMQRWNSTVNDMINKDDHRSISTLANVRGRLTDDHYEAMANKGHREYVAHMLSYHHNVPDHVWDIVAKHPNPNISSVGKSLSS